MIICKIQLISRGRKVTDLVIIGCGEADFNVRRNRRIIPQKLAAPYAADFPKKIKSGHIASLSPLLFTPFIPSTKSLQLEAIRLKTADILHSSNKFKQETTLNSCWFL
jgi:hypothetical protein